MLNECYCVFVMSDGFLFSGIQHGAKFCCLFGCDRWLLANRKQEIKHSVVRPFIPNTLLPSHYTGSLSEAEAFSISKRVCFFFFRLLSKLKLFTKEVFRVFFDFKISVFLLLDYLRLIYYKLIFNVSVSWLIVLQL